MKTAYRLWLTDPTSEDRESAYFVTEGLGDYARQGWVLVREGTIEFVPLTRDQVIPKAVSALREKQREVQAEAAKRANDIEGMIQNLLCLGNEAPGHPGVEIITPADDRMGKAMAAEQDAAQAEELRQPPRDKPLYGSRPKAKMFQAWEDDNDIPF